MTQLYDLFGRLINFAALTVLVSVIIYKLLSYAFYTLHYCAVIIYNSEFCISLTYINRDVWKPYIHSTVCVTFIVCIYLLDILKLSCRLFIT